MDKNKKRIARHGRHARIREKIKGTNSKPRLCVFRSLHHIYAQIIDDSQGNTLVSASTIDPEIRGHINSKKKIAQAELVGALVAKRAIDMGIKCVVFDRGGYKYHGRVQTLAEAVRKGGLKL